MAKKKVEKAGDGASQAAKVSPVVKNAWMLYLWFFFSVSSSFLGEPW